MSPISSGKIFDLLGFDGALHLHFGRYGIARTLFSGSTDASFLNANTKWDFAENKTTWANTDTRLGHNVLPEWNLSQEMRSVSWGGAVLLKTFSGVRKWRQMAPYVRCHTREASTFKGLSGGASIATDGPSRVGFRNRLSKAARVFIKRKLKSGK